MANSKSAKKRVRQALVRRERNRMNTSVLKTSLKKFRAEVAESLSQPDRLQPAFQLVQSQIAVARRKGVLHKNKMARLVRQCYQAISKPNQ
jgi:small subunit ribosomal protein S20